jgi:hypothetical protein
MRVLHEGIFKGAFQGDEMDAKPSVLYAYGEEKRERERTKDNAGSDNNTNPQTRFRCQLREPSRKKKKKTVYKQTEGEYTGSCFSLLSL